MCISACGMFSMNKATAQNKTGNTCSGIGFGFSAYSVLLLSVVGLLDKRQIAVGACSAVDIVLLLILLNFFVDQH